MHSISRYRAALVALAALLGTLFGAEIDEATRRQYEELVKRQHVGGRIKPEERQSMMKVFPQHHPARESTGMVALTDLGKKMYQGEQGGLYPGGENSMPAAHMQAGLEQARQIVPLDREGRPSPDGKIALMSVGMSNTTMEFQTFIKRAAQEKGLNPRVALVDGAQGGQSSLETSDPKSNYWTVVDQRMKAAGVTAQQVQALWMFQVVVTPNRPFPLDARRLQSLEADTLRVASERFPNLKIAYLSSRIYAGYALVPQNPEPHSYESGFAPKWIIADQIAGYLEYNFDPARGRVRFPWVAWGPYMWADGVKGRSDGLKWVREDFGVDGMHPSESGRQKVVDLLMQFLKTDPTSRPWFVVGAQAPAPTAPSQSASLQSPPPPNRGLDPNVIRQKVQRGETLTPEERQLLQQRTGASVGAGAGGQNNQQMQQRRAQYMKEHPPQPSLGLIPLSDLGSGKYKGEEGGLYPGGKNVPPAGHLDAGLKLAREIAPLDAGGKKSPDGKIVLLSIGFSNPSIEFPVFQRRVAEDAAVNPRLVTVNGCVGSQGASTIADPKSNYWNTVDQRLSSAGVTGKQVQAVWLKEVNPGPSQPFPAESKKLYQDMVGSLHNLRERFPNLKVAYLSSRTYGAYTELGGSPEPWAYETGFAVKWVVSDQIAGKPEMNFDPTRGVARSPWVAWGPYLWTDGVKGRRDGFVYLREDVREDGLHPSDKGSAKIANLMMNFFKSDPTARIWFLK
jgi:lysophospholipase L1-like esterase